MELGMAELVTRKIVERVPPYCECIQVAGSVRRRHTVVGSPAAAALAREVGRNLIEMGGE